MFCHVLADKNFHRFPETGSSLAAKNAAYLKCGPCSCHCGCARCFIPIPVGVLVGFAVSPHLTLEFSLNVIHDPREDDMEVYLRMALMKQTGQNSHNCLVEQGRLTGETSLFFPSLSDCSFSGRFSVCKCNSVFVFHQVPASC